MSAEDEPKKIKDGADRIETITFPQNWLFSKLQLGITGDLICQGKPGIFYTSKYANL